MSCITWILDLETYMARIVGFEVTPNNLLCSHLAIPKILSIMNTKVWDEKNPQLVTSNPTTKVRLQGGTVPLEVDADKDVVFT